MNENATHLCVFITCATGFLAAQVARRLLKEANLTLITLVRAETDDPQPLNQWR